MTLNIIEIIIGSILKKSIDQLNRYIELIKAKAFSQRGFFVYLAVACVTLLLFSHQGGFISDMNCWADWALAMQEKGISNIYSGNNAPNYFPLSLYIIYSVGRTILALGFDIKADLYMFKYLFFFFDILNILVVYKILKFYKIDIFKTFLILFNIAFLYNTLIWGQVDTIYTSALLISVYFFLTRRNVFGLLFCLLALNLKLQAIATIPIILVFFLRQYLNKKDIINAVFVLFFAQLLILLPFIYSDNLHEVKMMFDRLPNTFTNMALNAFNYWVLVFGYEGALQPDNRVLLWGLTAKTIGMLIFGFITALLSSVFCNSVCKGI